MADHQTTMAPESTASSLLVPPVRTLPFGEQQGSFWGVVASSNRDDGFFSGESNYVNHLIFTGFRYQCVEYARRFLLLTTGCVFSECGRASEIYQKRELTHVETGETFPFLAHDNGRSTRKPQPGDIIIYPYDNDLCPWGHIGVISYVDDTRVGIAEQNQFFGPFLSPSPDYLDGERCVGRFLELEQNAKDGSWLIKETSSMPSPMGWMSYPGTTRRARIFQPFEPLPAFIAERSSPMDDPKHPFLYHLRIPEVIELPCGGRLSHVYGLARGAGETAVASGTGTCRILRFTLQFLFRRSHIGSAFLSLPSNPLNADVQPCAALDRLFRVYAEELGQESGNEAKAFLALAEYFGVPVRWIAAMQREYAKGELHMFANLQFAMHAFQDDIDSDVAEPTAGGLDECSSPSQVYREPHKLRTENPHDETWQLGKVDFGTCKLMVELPQVAAVLPAIQANLEFQLPDYRCFGKPSYSYDFGNYLKSVEECWGPRTALAIVLSEGLSEMSGPQRELVTTVQSCCEKVKYPVRVVSEADLHYDRAEGKLYAHISEASPPIGSPTALAPVGDFEVNFVFALVEWEEVLRVAPDRHRALFDAATDSEKSDVAFAKPLWSYLVSGLVHRAPEDAVSPARCAVERHAMEPLSIKFFDIVRRLYDYALPRQAAETWDQEVSEFKGSCRRLGVSTVMPTEPAAGFISNCAAVNFAFSAFMAHSGGRFTSGSADAAAGEGQGEPAAVLHVFPADRE